MQISNMDCLQFGWFKQRRMNQNNLAVYDILSRITNAADDRSEHVFRPNRNLQAIWIRFINIRMENIGITEKRYITKKFASFAAKNSKLNHYGTIHRRSANSIM